MLVVVREVVGLFLHLEGWMTQGGANHSPGNTSATLGVSILHLGTLAERMVGDTTTFLR